MPVLCSLTRMDERYLLHILDLAGPQSTACASRLPFPRLAGREWVTANSAALVPVRCLHCARTRQGRGKRRSE